MTPGWRKVENEKGFPYYFNEELNLKQWDHPKFSEIRQRIDDCNYVKYSTYRVALKFRVLQQALFMDEVSLSIISGVFEKHCLGANESSLCLESCDLEAVLSDIYFASNKKNHTTTDIDYATELMVNFLYNVYDEKRLGKIQVSSTKIVLAILSNCTLSNLNKFIYTLCADHNNCVTRLRLQGTLMKLVQVISFLHEDVSFGQHLINSSIEDCFRNSPGLVGINESMFLTWVEKSPQILSWLPILHRIKMAEPVVHTGKCNTCKISPILGLRYKCIKCSRYIQCQRCFFSGRTSSSHKLTHSMKEYCAQANSSDFFTHTVIKKLCGLFPCAPKTVPQSNSVIETKPLSTEKDFCASGEILCDIEPLSSPQAQLQVIIRQLELQNRELHQILLYGNHTDKEIRRYLEEHSIHVAAQVQKLKILKEYLTIPVPDKTPPTKQLSEVDTESTPMVENGRQRNQRNTDLDILSPIVSKSYQNQIPSTSRENSGTESMSIPYSVNDISTWIGGHPTASNNVNLSKSLLQKTPVREFHNDLDEALAKLQQILANNFTLDESLGHIDNTNLKYAVSEVEGMLTSFIDNVETSRPGTTMQPHSLKFDENV